MKLSLITVLPLVLILAACGTRYTEAPRNLDNACALLNERPPYERAFRQAERKWNVPRHVMMAMMHQESRFDGDARTPMRYAIGIIPLGRQSSAYGYSQALDGTWEEYEREEGRGRRTNIYDATDFMGWYMNKTLQRNGIPLSDARRQYLAYHEGHTGYSRRSYLKKAWLIDVSSRVSNRAEMYQRQLRSCR